MKEFFKFMFASMLGVLLSLFLFMIVLMIMLASAISFSSGDEVNIPEKSVLHMKLDMPLMDRGLKSPFGDLGAFGGEAGLGLNQIIRSLENAAKDDRIKGIYLEMGMMQAGPATVEEIRDALISFRASGKPIIAYGNMASQMSYYLASAADKVYLNPLGSIDFSGLTAQVVFFKGLSEKMKVDMQIIRPANNSFKSAVEPFYLDKMSEANREQTGKYLQAGWNHMVEGIAKSRNADIQQLNLLADSLTAFRAKNALSSGLVDGLLYQDQLTDTMKAAFGLKEKGNIHQVTVAKYDRAIKGSGLKDKEKGKKEGQIVVIYASGDIVMGDEEDRVISADHISATLRKARENKMVKAIVLRVNSPGGDGLASEIIWREVALAAKEKPVIVSMGDYAASGGYYIACAATRIVAQPNTLTGSIGVFGVMPNLQKLFNEHLGITFDEVTTNKNSSFGSLNRPLNPFEMEMLKGYVEDFYTHFTSRVSEGRNIPVNQVDSIGQGRVWSGVDALKIGLVDTLGGLEDAVKIAAKEAGIKNFTRLEWPVQTDPFMKFMKQLSGETSVESSLRSALGENYAYYEMLRTFSNLKGVQARLPFVIDVN